MPRHPQRLALLPLLGLLPLGGCSDGAPGDDDMVPVADVSTLMFTVIEPAAETYWDAVGWIIDAEGETYIRPRSAEEWEIVRNAAFQITESGNLLKVKGRGGADDGAWMAYSAALTDIGLRAIEAAEAEDPQAVFDVGAEVYFVCTSCHAAYSPEILRPNQTTGGMETTEAATTATGGAADGGSGDGGP